MVPDESSIWFQLFGFVAPPCIRQTHQRGAR